MKSESVYMKRDAAYMREAAARLCEREAEKSKNFTGIHSDVLISIARRIRRIPIAGFIGRAPK